MVSTPLIEQIKLLVEVQKIDAKIFELNRELAQFPSIQKKLEDDFEKKKVTLKKTEENLKTHQIKQKEKENDLASSEEKIKKLQGQLYQLKSNKEYSAMDLEIKGLKADKSLLEEEILNLLDVVEQIKSGVTKEKELLGQEEKKVKDELAKLKKKTDEIKQSTSEYTESRKTYTPNIDQKLLSQYERVLAKRDGLALVPVRNNSCGGCHMELPPQRVNEVQLQEKLLVCESCARILYWEP